MILTQPLASLYQPVGDEDEMPRELPIGTIVLDVFDRDAFQYKRQEWVQVLVREPNGLQFCVYVRPLKLLRSMT